MMCQNMFLTQNLPSKTLSYDTEKTEEVRLFLFNQMQKTRNVLVLYDMCSCPQNVDIKGWDWCRGMYSCIICHCIAWWRSIDIIAPINVLESDWLLMISFPKDINKVDSGTAFEVNYFSVSAHLGAEIMLYRAQDVSSLLVVTSR